MGKPNPQNLRPYKPGQSGNPKGKPKGARNRTTIVREWLERSNQNGDGQIVDAMVLAMVTQAIKRGDVSAFKELMDSGYGKVADKQESKVELDASIRGLSETADFLSGITTKRR